MITHSDYLEAKRIVDEYENNRFNSLEERKRKFEQDVKMNFGTVHPEQMLEAFILYWTEHNPKGFKMKFEMQKVFDIGRRLNTWSKNNFGNGTKSQQVSDHNADQLRRVIQGDL